MIKSFICGIFVLLLVITGPAWSAQPPGGHLNITEVEVDDPNTPMSITIMGEDLDFGGELDVTLGGYASLIIISATDTTIVATLPAGIMPGDYLLTVSRGEGQSQNDEYDLTIGAVGPQGPAGADGADGPAGADGTDGATGPAAVFNVFTCMPDPGEPQVGCDCRSFEGGTTPQLVSGGARCSSEGGLLRWSFPDSPYTWVASCVNIADPFPPPVIEVPFEIYIICTNTH